MLENIKLLLLLLKQQIEHCKKIDCQIYEFFVQFDKFCKKLNPFWKIQPRLIKKYQNLAIDFQSTVNIIQCSFTCNM